MQHAISNVQPYDASQDAVALHELWNATVGQQWPLSAARLQQILTYPGSEPQHFVVREANEIVAFAATFKSYRGVQRLGHLAALLVAPHRQRQGLGRLLHTTVLQHLKTAGVSAVQLGSNTPRFWCGAPENLPDALSFFRAQGWDLSNPVYDLVQNLNQYHTPAKIYRRMTKEQITISVVTSANVTDALVFEAHEFPNWLPAFEHYANLGDYRDILVARNHEQQVVGTLLMTSPSSHPARTDLIWQALLGKNAGAIGSVGIAQSQRGHGIGIALVARASDLLKGRGVGNCYIDWVELTDFYAKLGYAAWRAYYPSWLL